MCWFFKRKVKDVPEKVEDKQRTLSDEIRRYVRSTYITPARMMGERRVSFTAGEIHHGMGLKDRMPAVCSAIDAGKFSEFAKVKLVSRKGKKQTSTVRWTFDIKR
jgi:5-methylcytosine-specific restriction protein B